MTRAEEFIAAARTFIGTPYRHRGRNAHGLDCVGLVIAAAEKLGIPITLQPYPIHVKSSHIYAEIGTYARRLRDEEVQPGDLVLLKGANQATHFGILTESETMVYLSPLRRLVIERRVSSVLSRAVGFYRLRGL